MDAQLLSGLSAPALRTFQAVRIELLSTGTAINLLDGSATISFPVDGVGVTFTGRDPVFGTLGGIDTIAEQIASEAPSSAFRSCRSQPMPSANFRSRKIREAR